MVKKDTIRTGISQNDQLLLEKCREIELLSRDLYYCFADTFKNDAEAEYLWRKTAREEQNHADQFSLALKLRKGLQLKTGISIEKAEQMISGLEKTIAKITQTPIPLIEALTFAVKLERHLSELHISCIAEFSDESFKSLFNAMMSSDRGHLETIEKFLDKRVAASKPASDIIMEHGTKTTVIKQPPVPTIEPHQEKILKLLIEQELLMSSIYQNLASLFPERANDYLELVAEEMKHAEWIEQLQTACQGGKARFNEGKTRSYTVSGMISYMQEFLIRLKAGQLTEIQALSAVANFESALIEKNVFQRFSGDSPEVEKVLKLLEDTQKKHTSFVLALLQHVKSKSSV